MFTHDPAENLKAYLSSKTDLFTQVRKRDGRLVAFDPKAILRSIGKAARETGEFDEEVTLRLTVKVIELAYQISTSEIPTVEEIQDIVEEVLIASPFRKTAKS